MYAHRHTKKRGTLIVACPALEAFELARITEQATKTPRRMKKYTQYLHLSRTENQPHIMRLSGIADIYHTHEHLSLHGLGDS